MKYDFTNNKCPRCGGNMYIDRDYYADGGLIGSYEQEACLQCGYINYEANSPFRAIAVNKIALQKEPLLV